MHKHQGPPPPGFMHEPPPYDGAHGPGVPVGGPSVVIMHNTQFGPDPQSMTCPFCNASVTTRIETSPSTKTHIIALLLCLFGCWPCCPCVYCIDSCLVKKHYCSNCHKYLGMHDN